MRQALLLMLFFVPAINIKAQGYLQDNLFLNNGNVIKGSVIKQVLNESVTIIDLKGDTIDYNYTEIEKQTRELVSGKIRKSSLPKSVFPGYHLIVEGTACLGVNMYSTEYLKLNLINGTRLNRLFYLGFGFGLRYNINTGLKNLSPDYTHLMFPVFTDFRTYISINKNTSTYLGLQLGCSLEPDQEIVWENSQETTKVDYARLKNRGALINSSAGISFSLSDKRMLHLGITCELQNGTFTRYDTSGNYDMFYIVDKFAVSVGISTGITF